MSEDLGTVNSVTIGVLRERTPGETRVALVPQTVQDLRAQGLDVVMESGCGAGAYFDDAAYALAGARIASSPRDVLTSTDILAKVRAPLPDEIGMLRSGSLVIAFLDPVRDDDALRGLSEAGIAGFSFNAVPRITKAQAMDAMSSMSTIAGYKSVIVAAASLGRIFPMLMTAAGTIAPARVLVIGAGVAGLQALATARRLGAVTAACDARPAVREQIQSVGAVFIDMSVTMEETAGGYAQLLDEEMYRLERDAIRDHVANSDVVISTAQVPGARAPLLIDAAMVQAMRHGSVIVDLASESGGNCELSVPGETVVQGGIIIHAPFNIPASVPTHSSQMYARNVWAVIKHVVRDGSLQLDFDDDILKAACIARPAGAPA